MGPAMECVCPQARHTRTPPAGDGPGATSGLGLAEHKTLPVWPSDRKGLVTPSIHVTFRTEILMKCGRLIRK